MPLLVFWLTPVVLVLVLALLLLRFQPKRKSKLVVIEPLLLLIDQWHLSRIIGDDRAVIRHLRQWQQGLELTHSTVEQLARQIVLKPSQAGQAAILEQRRLPFWAEQRVIEVNGKKSALLCGSVGEVLEHCDADDAGALTSEKRREWQGLASTAARNGFLALACAETSNIDSSERPYRFMGLAILEPVYNQEALKKFRALSGVGQVRLLSFLPVALLEIIREKLLPAAADPRSISEQELQELPPRQQETAIENSNIYGEIPTRSRYYIARQLQHRYELLVASRVGQDSDIPADVLL